MHSTNISKWGWTDFGELKTGDFFVKREDREKIFMKTNESIGRVLKKNRIDFSDGGFEEFTKIDEVVIIEFVNIRFKEISDNLYREELE